MADIKRYPGLRHFRGAPTVHVRHVRGGKVIHQGTAQSFWFRPLSAVLSEVPVDDRELPMMFHASTADFQDVTVQAAIAYRVSDPATAAARLDFSLDPERGVWRGQPLEQLGSVLGNAAHQRALEYFAQTPLDVVLANGVGVVRDRIAEGLAADTRLAETGVTIIGVQVVAIRPQPEMEKALQTPTREEVQQEADKATFERRALAVERESAIAENEMTNQIELARREEQLVTQRGANARRSAEEAAAASAVQTESQASRDERLGKVAAESTRAMGEARAAEVAAQVHAYREMDQGTLLAYAMKELAANIPKIQSLVVTPDLLAQVLANLGKPGGSGGTAPAKSAPRAAK